MILRRQLLYDGEIDLVSDMLHASLQGSNAASFEFSQYSFDSCHHLLELSARDKESAMIISVAQLDNCLEFTTPPSCYELSTVKQSIVHVNQYQS
jgi:hypothetical protein